MTEEMNNGQNLAATFKHGINGYNKHKCKCEICSNAHKEYTKNYRSQKLEKIKAQISDHGLSGYNSGCRCDQCCNANKEQNKQKRKANKKSEHEYKHGMSRYSHGCRCDICKKAYSDYNKNFRNIKKLERESNPETNCHGIYGYDQLFCRCDICKKAKSDKNKKYRKEKEIKFKQEGITNHGIIGYEAGCRCEICKKDKTEKDKKYKTKLNKKPKQIKEKKVQPQKDTKTKKEKKQTEQKIVKKEVKKSQNQISSKPTQSPTSIQKPKKHIIVHKPEDYLRKSFIIKPDENKPKPVIINEENTGFTIVAGFGND